MAFDFWRLPPPVRSSSYAAPLVPCSGGHGESLVFCLIVGCGSAVKARRGRESDSSRFASTASTTGTIGRAECASRDRGNSAHESSLLTNVSIPKPKAGAIKEALAAIVGEHYPTGPPKTEDKAWLPTLSQLLTIFQLRRIVSPDEPNVLCKIVKKVGQGGFGTVYKAQSTKSKGLVAIK
ncbi:hypothetical protein EV175_001752 [Coemansia sp. RSA 1933]|nr:hypothetical protein EV175_001752 [Coemansia sp. RSA 1933]